MIIMELNIAYDIMMSQLFWILRTGVYYIWWILSPYIQGEDICHHLIK